MPRPPPTGPIVHTALLLGRCIATMRDDLGVSQAELARRLRLSRASFGHVETGRTTPSFYVLTRLGAHFRRERADLNAAAVVSLFELSVHALRERGVQVWNRPPRENDVLLDVARIDRIVGIVFEAEFNAYRRAVPAHDAVTFAGDDDDDDDPRPTRVILPDPKAR